MKLKVVVFKHGKARILTNPKKEHLAKLEDPHVVNPDLSLVNRVSPEYWKLEDGKVVPMTDSEKDQRKQELKQPIKTNKVKTKVLKTHEVREVLVPTTVEVEVVREVQVSVPVEVIREVEVIKEKIVEVERQVEIEIAKVPKWTWALLALSVLLNLILLLK